jgi:protein-tyrosine phosphatase
MAARMAQMRGPRAAEPLYSADHRTLLEYALDEVNTKWGSVEGYLDQEVGVSAADIAKLRQMYLE